MNDAQLIPASALKAADAEMQRAQQRGKEEELALLVQEFERVQDTTDGLKVQVKAGNSQMTELVKTMASLGFQKSMLKQALKERRKPRTLFDQEQQSIREQVDAIHNLLQGQGVKRA